MLKIEVIENGVNIAFSGDQVDVAVEVGIAMGGIYNSIKQEDPFAAEVFRSALAKTLAPGSPVWEPREGAATIKIPVNKKGGAPTDQS